MYREGVVLATMRNSLSPNEANVEALGKYGNRIVLWGLREERLEAGWTVVFCVIHLYLRKTRWEGTHLIHLAPSVSYSIALLCELSSVECRMTGTTRAWPTEELFHRVCRDWRKRQATVGILPEIGTWAPSECDSNLPNDNVPYNTGHNLTTDFQLLKKNPDSWCQDIQFYTTGLRTRDDK
jgi:hypothetical protein